MSKRDLLEHVSKNIRRIRKKKGLTQQQMADYDFDVRHYQKIESGRVNISLSTLERLSSALKVDPEDFFK